MKLDWSEIAVANYGEENKSFSLSNSEVKLLLLLVAGNQDIRFWQSYPDQETVDHFTETLIDKLLGESMAHTHDDRYFTEGEITTALAGKSNTAHTHDDRYFTEGEITTALAGKSNTGHTHPRAIGEVIMWPADSPPAGWLLCAGQAVSRSTYGALFSVIGTTFGAGNGSTTFNLPDLRGRFALGKDDMGGSSANRVTAAAADVIGGSGGGETHTLTINESPNHSHTGLQLRRYDSDYGGVGDYQIPEAGAVSAQYSSKSYTTNAVGGGTPHNNMPPYTTLNFIIYVGV